jgi:hypothetical protein
MEASMMSVISVLVAVLVMGFFAVGLVAYFGWRERMRREPDVWAENYEKAA